MADIFRHLTIANLLPYKISYGFSEGTVRRRPPNGNGCHPACIALASGLFADCLYRLASSIALPEARKPFAGRSSTPPIDTPTRANGRKPAKKRSPYSPGRRGTRGTHYQVGDIRSYLFNNITVYSFFLQSPRKRFPVPPASCRPASGLDVSKEASPAGTMTSPAGHTPTGLPLRLSPR